MAEIKKEESQSSPDGSTKDPQKEQKKKSVIATLVMLVPFCVCM